MNLLTKDKYRTKIMEHLLHQYENEQQNLQNQNPYFDEIKDLKDQCQKMNPTLFFDKLSKQKALINDGQNTQRIIKNQKSLGVIDFIEKQNKSQKSNRKQNIINQFIQSKKSVPQIPLKGHLKKQTYTYHQKLPLIQISKPEDFEIFNKINKAGKTKISNENKQNNQSILNAVLGSESNLDKKYKFIIPNKVTEALKSKRQTQREKEKEEEKSQQAMSLRQEFEIQPVNQKASLNTTYRSKGSREMMQFLESAREKLLQNINQPNRSEEKTEDNIQKSVNLEKQLTESKQNDKFQQNTKNQKEIFCDHEFGTFKIQIQVSDNKTCEIELNLDSDPYQVAKKFIQSNKSELSSFKDLQIQKLLQLLSQKIFVRIQKQKKIINSKKNTQSHQTHKNNRKPAEMNQKMQTKNVDNLTNKKVQQNNQSNRKFQKKSDRKLQYSHIYIENIEQAETHQQIQLKSQNLQSQNQKVSPKMTKLITFNPSNQLYSSENRSVKQIELAGYLNSPHQLITYRPQDSLTQNETQTQNSQAIVLEQQGYFNHIPLCKSISQLPNKIQIQQGTKKIKDEEGKEEIGAAKILSKSRQKLNKYKQQKLKEIKQDPQLFVSSASIKQVPLQLEKSIVNIHKNQNLQKTIKSPQDTSYPVTMNKISEQIVSYLGKENILNSLRQKKMLKRQKIIREIEQKQNQQIKECSFKPKINRLSKSIDENKKKKVKIGELLDIDNEKSYEQNKQCLNKVQKNFFRTSNPNETIKQSEQFQKIISRLQKPQRFQQLYQNHKEIQAKKEFNRQKSLQQISFKPEINPISKKIVQTKRNSLNNSLCQQSYSLCNSKRSLSKHHSTCKKPTNKSSVHYGNDKNFFENQLQTNHKKRKSLNASRNIQGLEIGDYLYKEAMRMKKKRQSIPNSKAQNFKPLHKSQQIMNKLKEKRLSEYFYELINDENNQNKQADDMAFLTPEMINLQQQKFSKPPLKYLVPLLEELKQLEVQLTREQFIQSGMKLINFLSQDQKADFLNKRVVEEEKQNIRPILNKTSQQLIQKKQYMMQDIYHRGLQYQKQVKERIENSFENKVRKQLQKCTFRPKINGIYQLTERE